MRALFAGLFLIVATAVAATTIVLARLVAPSGRLFVPIAAAWARSILAVAGVRVDAFGSPRLAGGGPVLYLSNHQSNLDGICHFPSLSRSGQEVRFIAKRSLAFVPFLGLGMLAAGFIFIDRRDRERAVRSLERAAATIRGGRSVLVFPEGTRSRDGALGELKKGPFHLACAAGVPIIPIAVSGTRALMPRGRLAIRAGRVTVRFGAPILVDETATPERLAAQVRAALLELLAADPAAAA